MKTYYSIIINLFLTVFPIVVYGQQTINLNPESLLQSLQYKSNEDIKKQENLISGKTNSVFIQQIGGGNTINSTISSPTASLDLNQNGSFNNIDLFIEADSYQSLINQTGDHNNIFENIHSPSSNISLELTQYGQNNHFERYGSNAIGDRLQFNMIGNDKAIIVRNFNEMF